MRDPNKEYYLLMARGQLENVPCNKLDTIPIGTELFMVRKKNNPLDNVIVINATKIGHNEYERPHFRDGVDNWMYSPTDSFITSSDMNYYYIYKAASNEDDAPSGGSKMRRKKRIVKSRRKRRNRMNKRRSRRR